MERLLKTTRGMSWEKVESVGEGEEYRASLADAVHGSALTFEDSMIRNRRGKSYEARGGGKAGED